MPPHEPDAKNEHARRPQPAELTEQIPAPGETRSSAAPDEEKYDATSAFQEPWASTLGQTDRDRSVSTPTNNTKPSSATEKAGIPPLNPYHPAKVSPAW
jgi:hypothetical protein